MSRETVITFVDGEDFAHVWTNIKRDITALSRKIRPAVDGVNNEGRYAEFVVPADLFRPAGVVGSKRNMSTAAREAAAERMRNWHREKE